MNDRRPRHFLLEYLLGVSQSIIGTILLALVALSLPHSRIAAPIIWLVVSLIGMALGLYSFRTATWWHYLCTIAAVLSMAAWVFAFSTYRIREETKEIPRGYTLALSVTRHDEGEKTQNVDLDKIRQEERERIQKASAEKWSDMIEYCAMWTWLVSCSLWSVTLVHALNRKLEAAD